MCQATAASEQETAKPRPPGRKRLWMFRLLACSLALLLFLIAEVVCRLFGLGDPNFGTDPFAGFQEVRPLFVLDESNGRYQIPESRYNFFAAESFPKTKQSREKRIFCLGGSTVQGRPYSTPTSFPTFLELGLNATDQSADWEVVNCGGISYASYRLVPILEEVHAYQPDIIILCTGHNEFLEDRSYHHLKDSSSLLSQSLRVASHSWLFNAVSQMAHSKTERPKLSAETDPILDYNDGLVAYHRDDEWHANVITHFAHNVRRIIQIAEESQVAIALVVPPSNLDDCPPFKSTNSRNLANDERARFQRLRMQGQDLMRNDPQAAVSLFREAIAIDDRHAATWYQLGQCFQTLGLRSQAHEAFVRARDEDICPLRILSRMEEQLREIAVECDVPILDVSVLMQDGRSLVDHVHPDFEGHQDIAKRLMELMDEYRWCQLEAEWQEHCDRKFLAHMDSLDDFYYLRGQRTLEALQAWTEGRADGPPVENRFPDRIR